MKKPKPKKRAVQKPLSRSAIAELERQVTLLRLAIDVHAEQSQTGYRHLADMRAEIGERLRVLEADLEHVRKYFAVVAAKVNGIEPGMVVQLAPGEKLPTGLRGLERGTDGKPHWRGE